MPESGVIGHLQLFEPNLLVVYVTTFTNDTLNASIRVIDQAGEPWFLGMDLAEPLGLYSTLLSQRIKHLDDDEKLLVSRSQLNLTSLGRGGQQKRWLVSESGLYKLIMRGQRTNPLVVSFQDWVTEDVLPAIRKDGAYLRITVLEPAGPLSVWATSHFLNASIQIWITAMMGTIANKLHHPL